MCGHDSVPGYASRGAAAGTTDGPNGPNECPASRPCRSGGHYSHSRPRGSSGKDKRIKVRNLGILLGILCLNGGARESCLADPRRASHFVCGSVGVSKQNGRCELQRVPRTQLILSRWGRGPGGQVTNWKISGRTECRGANGRGLAGIGREEEQTAH